MYGVVIVENTNDNVDIKENFKQIILKYESVYIVKFIIFIVVFSTVFVNPFIELEKIIFEQFLGSFTFVITTLLDCIVLARNSKLKGKIVNIQLTYLILMSLFTLFIILFFIKKIEINFFTVCICDFISIFCCVSPLIELLYDAISHLQNERNNQY